MSEIDRAAADGKISADDAATLHTFSDFLADPTSRCGICLNDDHVRPSQCPEVTDADRRRIGVMVMDRNMAARIARIRSVPRP